MSGKLIVIEGLDGSGKATQTALLAQALEEKGIPVKKVSFPAYESDSSALVRMYLAGQFGPRADDVNAYAASCFYAVDRFASFKTGWQEFFEKGGVVLADRYTTSNAIHQCAKLPKEEWDGYLDWLFDFEYEKIRIPAPTAVVYLRVDPTLSQKLMSGRYQGNEAKKDIHEKDVEYLNRSRAAADYCAARLGWHSLECVQEGGMRSIEEIHEEIMKTLEGLF